MNPTDAQQAYGWWWALLYDFQTLAAALIALIGAGITVWALAHQTKRTVKATEQTIDAQRELESARLEREKQARADEIESIQAVLIIEMAGTAVQMASNAEIASAVEFPNEVDFGVHEPPEHQVFNALAARLIEIDIVIAASVSRFHSHLRTLRTLLEGQPKGTGHATLSYGFPVRSFLHAWRSAIVAAAEAMERYDELRKCTTPTVAFGKQEPSLAAALKREAENFRRKPSAR